MDDIRQMEAATKKELDEVSGFSLSNIVQCSSCAHNVHPLLAVSESLYSLASIV